MFQVKPTHSALSSKPDVILCSDILFPFPSPFLGPSLFFLIFPLLSFILPEVVLFLTYSGDVGEPTFFFRIQASIGVSMNSAE